MLLLMSIDTNSVPYIMFDIMILDPYYLLLPISILLFRFLLLLYLLNFQFF